MSAVLNAEEAKKYAESYRKRQKGRILREATQKRMRVYLTIITGCKQGETDWTFFDDEIDDIAIEELKSKGYTIKKHRKLFGILYEVSC